MKITNFLLLFIGFITSLVAQEFDFDNINMNKPGISISASNLDSGGFSRSYKVIPRDIDSYSMQKITGIKIITDAEGKFLRLDPIMYKIDLPELAMIFDALEKNTPVKTIVENARFSELTEIQKSAFLRKFAMAILICEDKALNFVIDDDVKKLFNQNLKIYNIEVKNESSPEELRLLSKLIIRKVSL